MLSPTPDTATQPGNRDSAPGISMSDSIDSTFWRDLHDSLAKVPSQESIAVPLHDAVWWPPVATTATATAAAAPMAAATRTITTPSLVSALTEPTEGGASTPPPPTDACEVTAPSRGRRKGPAQKKNREAQRRYRERRKHEFARLQAELAASAAEVSRLQEENAWLRNLIAPPRKSRTDAT